MDKIVLNMDFIDWIHIIDEKGTPVVVFETYKQGNSDINEALLSNLLVGLKSIAAGLTYNEIKIVNIGNKKFYMMKEDQSDYTFIFKVDIEKKFETAIPLLKEVKELFLYKYFGLLRNKPAHEKENYYESIKEDIKKILNMEKPNAKELID